MSRKGYQPTVLTQTEIKTEKKEYSVHFSSRQKLDSLLEVKEKVKDHTKQKVTDGLVTNYAGTWSTLKWNGEMSGRSTWLLGGTASGLIRIWDVSTARKKEKFGPSLSRGAFDDMCSKF